MRRPWKMITPLVSAIALIGSGSAMEVRFARDAYVVAAGGDVAVAVVVEFGPGETPGDFFSYGVRLVTGGEGEVRVGAVDVPAELDYTAFASGATVDLSPGVTGVKGNTQYSGAEFPPYTGTLLATFTVTGVESGEVDLGLELFRTLGASEDVFVAADGTKLDPTITFGTARLTVARAPGLKVSPMSADRIRVDYQMAPGMRYFLRRSEDLEEWNVVAETVGGAALGASFEFFTAPGGRAFFRLEAVSDGS